MFMTLGNFEVDPRAGLAVLDFERGSVVSLSGSARLHVDDVETVLGVLGSRMGPVRLAVHAALGVARQVIRSRPCPRR
jgi:hypothetical protein